MLDIKEYTKLGYELSPYASKEDLKTAKAVRLIEIREEDIADLLSLVKGPDKLINYFKAEEDEVVLFKCLSSYHYSPKDLLTFLDEYSTTSHLEFDDLEYWSHLFAFKYKGKHVIEPNLDFETIPIDKYSTDYWFDEPDHVVIFTVNWIRHFINEEKPINVDKIKTFIKEVTKFKNKPVFDRKYSDDTLSLIIQNISHLLTVEEHSPNDELVQYYRANLVGLAKRGDYDSIKTLGYEYYEGSSDFECNPIKSTELLEKAFSISGDPDLARTLGYVYYYGRTTNGVPQGDKAFQYFAIGHIAGGYLEATYKLADCYVKGYGTPVCHQAAFNLVSKIYDPTLERFVKGDDSKFADVALRLGSYYKDGIHVKKDLEEARIYYLEAKVAIKKRLEHMEYIGDRGVALGISKSINDINKSLPVEERIIDMGGYLLPHCQERFANVTFDFELVDEGLVKMTMTRPKNSGYKYLLHYISRICFAECATKVEYLIGSNAFDETFIKDMKKAKIKEVKFDKDEFFIDFKEGPGLCFEIHKVIYVPQTLQTIDKVYPIVSVEFYPGSKLYDYLSTKKINKIGDKLTVFSNGENKVVTVKEIKYVYEDELPLPLEKMAKAR